MVQHGKNKELRTQRQSPEVTQNAQVGEQDYDTEQTEK